MGCYQSVSFLGGFNGDALSVVFWHHCPVCRCNDFDVDSLYRAGGTALAEFITILLTAGGMFYRGQMSW